MKWVDIVNALTWAHISDAEFIAAAKKLGALHVHAARTLIKKRLRGGLGQLENKFLLFRE